MSDSMLIDEGDQDHTSHSMSSEEDQFQGDDSEIGVAELDEGEEEELESEEDDLPTLGTDAPELELGPIDDDENRMPLEEIPKIASGRPASRDFSKEKRTMEEGLERLLEIGKAQGHITFEQFNQCFPEECNTPERIDAVYDLLEAHDLEITDDPVKIDDIPDEPDFTGEKIDDPVRMYLTQMGEIPLLTRAEELLLAKTIETCRDHYRTAIYSSGFCQSQMIRLCQEVLCGDQAIDKVIKLTPSSGEPSREDMLQRMGQNLATIERLYQLNLADKKKLDSSKLTDRYKDKIREKVHERLNHLQKDQIDLLQLQTWTAAWNDDPQPLLVLKQLQQEGKIDKIGINAPEQDQSCVIQLMRDGLVDTVQIIFNLFQQEAASQILPVAEETGTGVLVRVPLDEGSLSGTYPADHQFAESDYRSQYFAGDRQHRTAERVQQIRSDLESFGIEEQYSMTDVALKFILARNEVSSILVSMRTVDQVERHCRAAGRRDLSPEILQHLQRHNWRKGIWYSGK